MQRQIIKVNDIHKAIQETGLEYYVDRLIQDACGDYFWVEYRVVDSINEPIREDWTPCLRRTITKDNTLNIIAYHYHISKIPKELAWFCIDAIKLQSDVLSIGSGEYEGPHGGKMTYLKTVNSPERFEEISPDVVRVEEL